MRNTLNLKNVPWLALSALVIIIDYWTKSFALTHLVNEGASVTVLPVFNWTLAYNHGAAFSFLSGAGGWQRWFFSGLAVVAAVMFVVWILRLPANAKLLAVAISLILGGALGNLVDRVTLGYVIDFIQVHYQEHYFPVFNMADCAITLGAMLLIFDMLFLEKKRVGASQ